jgi:DNA-binding CsgD family transcriptional regulator
MASGERLDGLIDRIYAAALDQDSWSDVVAEVGATAGATSATSLWFGQGGTELLQAHLWNIDPEALVEYQQHYLAFCPRYRASQGMRVGAVYDDRHERDDPGKTARDYYDFMDRYELGLARIVLAEKRQNLTIGMNFYNRAQDGLSAEGQRILSDLAPHFRRACNLAQQLGDIADRAALAEDWFAARTASLTLDGSGNVVRINAKAETLLALADGLRVVQRRLVAATAADQARLRQELGPALGLAPANGAQSTGSFVLLSRPSGLPPFALSAVPMTRPTGQERAIVTIAPTVPHIAPAALSRAFGLTPSEASVAAALAEGKSPEQIARDRLVSLQTIRSQMKAIYARLEVGSQAELVSRITAAALGVRL